MRERETRKRTTMYQKVTGRDGTGRGDLWVISRALFSCRDYIFTTVIIINHPADTEWLYPDHGCCWSGEWRALRNYSKGTVHWRVSEWVGELMDSHRIIIVILIESIGGNYHRPSWTEDRIDFRGRSTTSEVLRAKHVDREKRFISRDCFCLITEDFKNKIYFGNPISC